MLATPDMGSSTALLGQLGLLGVVIGILVWFGGRSLFRAGVEANDDSHRQVAVRWIGWGAAVLTVGVAMTAVGLVLLALMLFVLAQ